MREGFCLAKIKICFQFILCLVQKAFLRILSMKKTTFCVYSVWKWRHPAHAQFTHDDPTLHPIGPIEKIVGPRLAYWPNIFNLEQTIIIQCPQKSYVSVPLSYAYYFIHLYFLPSCVVFTPIYSTLIQPYQHQTCL